MCDPAYLYKNRPDITLISSNFSLYADMSQRVMQTLSSFSPDMEVYSIDEAFFILDGKDLEERSIKIRQKVLQWTGIPISIGIGTTKTLAKVANERAKKHTTTGVCVLDSESKVEEVLKTLTPGDIWGIGSNLNDRLKRKGIYTAEQFRNLDDSVLRKILGVGGLSTALELRGTNCYDLNTLPEKRKSIVCSRSFAEKIEDLNELHEAIASFTAMAAEKLRSQKCKASFLSVFLSEGFGHETASCNLPLANAISFTPELITLAKAGITRLFKEKTGYKRAGIMLGDFTEDDQIDFVTTSEINQKKMRAMEVLDEINARYDKEKIRFAAQGIDVYAKGRSHCSPKYTTNWDDLLKI
jgi:DNA polymerase V